jgi:F-type H+-transporting ATPase subunit a
MERSTPESSRVGSGAAFPFKMCNLKSFLLVSFVLLSAGLWALDVRAADESEKGGHTADKHADDAAHHEPNAIEHVMDSKDIPLFHSFWPYHIPLPPGITKFMVLELIAAGLIMAIYIPLARRIASGAPPRGAWDNTFEVLLTYVRDQIAVPGIGEHDADRFAPFLWTLFLFILFNNLLGMLPFGGSATASIFVTLGLAIVVFFAIHGSAISKLGFKHYASALWPDIDLPAGMGLVIKPLIFSVEWLGVLVRNVVLAVRLFANMFGGHMLLATVLIFIYTAGKAGIPLLWGTVTVSSVVGMVLLDLLELFVAFLQAYIFTFLASLFIGMAMHPEH